MGEPPRPQDIRYVTAAGLPLALRGSLALWAAGFSDTEEVSALAMALQADVPLVERVFFDARLPFGLTAVDGDSQGVLGNAMLGVRGVTRPGKAVWIGIGGALGLPLVTEQAYAETSYALPPVPHGLWDLHEYYPNIFPVQLAAELEAYAGELLAFRFQLEPVFFFPFINGGGMEMTIQHAAEVQVGIPIGGGLRIQGVALPTFDEIEASHGLVEGDLYQFAFEPFFRYEADGFFLRTGFMLPVDSQLGPPITRSWGLRLGAGVRL
jgi:hypothetical protein